METCQTCGAAYAKQFQLSRCILCGTRFMVNNLENEESRRVSLVRHLLPKLGLGMGVPPSISTDGAAYP